MINSVKMIFMN